MTPRTSYNYDVAYARIWSRVDKTSGNGPNGECWKWTGCLDYEGYGRTAFEGNTSVCVHRIIFCFTHNKTLQDVKHVLHTCDYRCCCNPNHLFEGTHRENMHDMGVKGRSAHGERSGNAKLTWDVVDQAKALYSTGNYSTRELAKMFSVGKTAMHRAVSGRGWNRHGLTDPNTKSV